MKKNLMKVFSYTTAILLLLSLFQACSKESVGLEESIDATATTDLKSADLSTTGFISIDPSAEMQKEIVDNIPEATVELIDFTNYAVAMIPVESCDEALSPTSFSATLKPEDSASEEKTACLDGVPAKGDVIFCMDLTGSMSGSLSNLKNNSINIMNEIANSISDSQFGLITHKDYPGVYLSCGYNSYYGGSTDFPYQLNQGLTSATADVATAINPLTVGGGGDLPESYERALFETYSDPGIGWRDGAARVVVAWLDNIPHDCLLAPPYNTTSGSDPGRDGIIGNADDIDMDDVIAGMTAENITLIVLSSGSSNITALWENYASLTGGTAIQINRNGTIPGGEDVATFISNLINESISSVSTLTLEANPPAYSSWISGVSPASYNDIVLDQPQEFGFDLTFTVPAGTADGLYNFNVDLVGDGAVYGTQTVEITVLTDSDGDGCTDDVDPHPNSNQDATIIIDGCDSGVANVFVTDCSTMSDLIADCVASANNHGQFVSCVTQLANDWKRAGLITGSQKGAIMSCAGGSSLP